MPLPRHQRTAQAAVVVRHHRGDEQPPTTDDLTVLFAQLQAACAVMDAEFAMVLSAAFLLNTQGKFGLYTVTPGERRYDELGVAGQSPPAAAGTQAVRVFHSASEAPPTFSLAAAETLCGLIELGDDHDANADRALAAAHHYDHHDTPTGET